MALVKPTPGALDLGFLIVLLWISGMNAFVDWGIMVSLVPAAYPRRRLFSAMTLIRLSPVLLWSLLLALFLSPSAVILVGTVIVAFHSLVFWLSVAPSPRYVYASRIHYLLNGACTVVGLLLFGCSGSSSSSPNIPFQRGCLTRGSSHFAIVTLIQPSVVWRVSGVCALLAILLWGHAYKRFKYMEGVPQLSRSGQRRWFTG